MKVRTTNELSVDMSRGEQLDIHVSKSGRTRRGGKSGLAGGLLGV